jgi:predicted dehydrogenase
MNNVLVFGYGNIAKKHIKNLKKINSKFNFFVIVKNLNKYKDTKNIKIFNSIKSLDLDMFKYVLICSPANTHLNYFKYFLNKKIKIFIEKPLDAHISLVKKYLRIIHKIKSDIYIGYVFRKSVLAKKVFQIIRKNNFGKIKYVKIKASSYLPDWRKNKNYKKTVSAKKKFGGGALLELSHELDYLFWFFGEPQLINSELINDKSLKIEVETGAKIEFKHKKGFKINVELDFHSKNKVSRFCEIIGNKNNLLWDIKRKKLIIKNLKTQKIKKYSEHADIYFEQMKYFIKKKNNPILSRRIFENSLKILKLINKVKLQGKINA